MFLNYNDKVLLNDEIQNKIYDKIVELFDGLEKITIKYKKNYVDEAILLTYVQDCIRHEFPIVEIMEKVEYNSADNILCLYAYEKYKKVIEEQSVCDVLSAYLKKQTKQEISVSVLYEANVAVKTTVSDDVVISNEPVADEIILESIDPFIGEKIEEKPRLIATVGSPCEGVALCGIVKNFMECKTKEKIVEGKVKPEKTYYKFVLADYTAEISVVYFPTKANVEKMVKIENGSELLIMGNVEDDTFSAGLVLRPKTINFCILPKGFLEKKYCKPCPKAYRYIFPEKYENKKQVNLFAELKQEVKNQYTLDTTFVVFDLETTGLQYDRDKIIEIGAVKVVNGELTETFSCLVDPEMHIPEDATKVNGIVDSDVKGQHTIGEVIGDFYKFCDGATIVSYVLDFDMKFMEYNARQHGYIFENPTLDAFVLAKQKLKGIKNYKLGTVCVACDVLLENAHRAVYDAVATGEVLVKLLEM